MQHGEGHSFSQRGISPDASRLHLLPSTEPAPDGWCNILVFQQLYAQPCDSRLAHGGRHEQSKCSQFAAPTQWPFGYAGTGVVRGATILRRHSQHQSDRSSGDRGLQWMRLQRGLDVPIRRPLRTPPTGEGQGLGIWAWQPRCWAQCGRGSPPCY